MPNLCQDMLVNAPGAGGLMGNSQAVFRDFIGNAKIVLDTFWEILDLC
jgi:hypothetical protein